jgi:hypothetical protein
MGADTTLNGSFPAVSSKIMTPLLRHFMSQEHREIMSLFKALFYPSLAAYCKEASSAWLRGIPILKLRSFITVRDHPSEYGSE